MNPDLCDGRAPGGITGTRPEIVRQSDLHSMVKVQKRAEMTRSLLSVSKR